MPDFEVSHHPLPIPVDDLGSDYTCSGGDYDWDTSTADEQGNMPSEDGSTSYPSDA
jgi:hypothetical protein